MHINLKYLPALRNARNDYECAAVDDFTGEAVVWIATEQTSATAAAFLERVLTALRYRIEAVLTDNAFAFCLLLLRAVERSRASSGTTIMSDRISVSTE